MLKRRSFAQREVQARRAVISKAADFALFRHFGFQTGREVDKFDSYKQCERVSNGRMSITAGTNAWIAARVEKAVDLGTHTMFIADVTDMEVLDKSPSCTYDYYLSEIKPKPQEVGKTSDGQTIWRCVICGYEYVGEQLPEDFICPICKHPSSDFEKVVSGGETAKQESVSADKKVWRCTVCGYEYEGDELPEDFVCPICGVPASDFEKV